MHACQVGRGEGGQGEKASLPGGRPGVVRSLQSCPDLEGGAISERGLPPGSRHDLG